MSNTLIFQNAKIVTAQEVFDGSVIVVDGKIHRVGRGENLGNDISGAKVIDLGGRHLLPGLIDVHVHFRIPGQPEKEDWVTGSKAALAGGVTTVLDMPNNQPPIVSAETLELKRSIVSRDAMVNYGFFVGATNDNIEEIRKCKNIAGVKIFMGSSTGSLLVDNKESLEKIFQLGLLCAVHAEDEACIREHSAKHSEDHFPSAHSMSRPPECAYLAVKEALHLAKKYDTRVHVCHVSTEMELETLRKFMGEKVSAEVTPHHLFLNDGDYDMYGNLIKVNPPIRAANDQVALWEGLKDGSLTMVASDHAPHTLAEKDLPYPDAPSGVPGVQTSLPLLLNAVKEGKLTLPKVVELMSYNPAKRFGIVGKGEISEGMDADLVVVDMTLFERLCHRYLWTKVDWSPFHGSWFTGWPVMTFVHGELAYEWRDHFYPVKGKEVTYDRLLGDA